MTYSYGHTLAQELLPQRWWFFVLVQPSLVIISLCAVYFTFFGYNLSIAILVTYLRPLSLLFSSFPVFEVKCLRNIFDTIRFHLPQIPRKKHNVSFLWLFEKYDQPYYNIFVKLWIFRYVSKFCFYGTPFRQTLMLFSSYFISNSLNFLSLYRCLKSLKTCIYAISFC